MIYLPDAFNIRYFIRAVIIESIFSPLIYLFLETQNQQQQKKRKKSKYFPTSINKEIFTGLKIRQTYVVAFPSFRMAHFFSRKSGNQKIEKKNKKKMYLVGNKNEDSQQIILGHSASKSAL